MGEMLIFVYSVSLRASSVHFFLKHLQNAHLGAIIEAYKLLNEVSTMDFMIGCNYWASNAGTDMWRNWDESAVREDVRVLSENGVEYMRVFPNWRDFQPVIPVYAYRGKLVKYCLEGDREPENPEYIVQKVSNYRTPCRSCRIHNECEHTSAQEVYRQIIYVKVQQREKERA